MCDRMNLPLLATIPLDPRMAEAADRGENYLQLYESSPAARAYIQLAEKVVEMCEKV